MSSMQGSEGSERAAFDLVELLLSGARTWNAWRRAHPKAPLDFSRADLRLARIIQADLQDANFFEANLLKADLGQSDLRGASFVRADLNCANLVKADLRGANLSAVNLGRARLIGVRLSGANLFEANLVKADLSGADLRGAKLARANLFEADLSNADLTGADLSKANLGEADLSSAILSSTSLFEANLAKADLGEARLRFADFSDADLSGAYLREADLYETTLDLANLFEADLSGASLVKAKFIIANLFEANLSEADLRDAVFIGANLSGARLIGAHLGRTTFFNTNAREADFSEAIFSEEPFRVSLEKGGLAEAAALSDCARALAEGLGFELEELGDWREGRFLREGVARIRDRKAFDAVCDKAELVQALLLGEEVPPSEPPLIVAARALEHALLSLEGAAAVDLGLLIFARRQDEEGFAFKKLTPEDRMTLDNDPSLISDSARLFTALESLKKRQATQTAAQLDGEGVSTEDMLH